MAHEGGTRRAVASEEETALLSAEALRRRVAELERALARRDNEQRRPAPATLEVAVDDLEAPPAPREGRGERGRGGERFERGQEDPERVAERQQRRDEMRQQFEQMQNDRVSFLAGIDTAGMNAAQRENHTRLLTALGRFNELSDLLAQGGAQDIDRREIFREIAESSMEIGELYESERDYLLSSTAKAVGYSGAEIEEFTAHLKAIFDNTSLMPNAMPGMGGGRRGGSGGGNFRR